MEKAKIKRTYPMKYVLIGIAAIILIVVGIWILPYSSTSGSASANDVSITGLKYGNSDPDTIAVITDYETSYVGASVYATLDYTSSKDVLYGKVFDKTGGEISRGEIYLQKGNENIQLIGYHLDDIFTPYQLSLCWTKKGDVQRGGKWDMNSPDVFCTSKTFEPPKINIDVKPDTILFSLEPKVSNSYMPGISYDCAERIVIVTNKGDFTISTTPALQNRDVGNNNQREPSLYIPSLDGIAQGKDLKAGESVQYKIKACADGNARTSQTTGYIVVGGRYYNNREKSVYEVPFTINIDVKKGA